jgi:hypothetical protein
MGLINNITQTRFEANGEVFYYHVVHISSIMNAEICEWCLSNFDRSNDLDRWFTDSWGTYFFRHEDDKNWFVLRWS